MTLTSEEMEEFFTGMEGTCKGIRKEATYLSWCMRGGATITDVLNMSQLERGLIAELANDNMEVTKKTQLNYF